MDLSRDAVERACLACSKTEDSHPHALHPRKNLSRFLEICCDGLELQNTRRIQLRFQAELAIWVALVSITSAIYFQRRMHKPLSARSPITFFSQILSATAFLVTLITLENEGLKGHCALYFLMAIVIFPALLFCYLFAVFRVCFLYKWTAAKAARTTHFEYKSVETIQVQAKKELSTRFQNPVNSLDDDDNSILNFSLAQSEKPSEIVQKSELEWFYQKRFVLSQRFFAVAMGAQLCVSIAIYAVLATEGIITLDNTVAESAKCEWSQTKGTSSLDFGALVPDVESCRFCTEPHQLWAFGVVYNYFFVLLAALGLYFIRGQQDALFLKLELSLFLGISLIATGTISAIHLINAQRVISRKFEFSLMHVVAWWSFITSSILPTLLSFPLCQGMFSSASLKLQTLREKNMADQTVIDANNLDPHFPSSYRRKAKSIRLSRPQSQERGLNLRELNNKERMHFKNLKEGFEVDLIDIYESDTPTIYFVLAHKGAHDKYYQFAAQEFTVESFQFITEVRAWKSIYIDFNRNSPSCNIGNPMLELKHTCSPNLKLRQDDLNKPSEALMLTKSNSIEQKKSIDSTDTRRFLLARGKWIVEKYVKPGALLEVNISHNARSNVMECIGNSNANEIIPQLTIMDSCLCAAEEEVLVMLEKDSWARFQKSGTLYNSVETLFDKEKRFYKYTLAIDERV